MFTTVFKPEACQGKDAKFKGEVVLKQPSYEERLEIAGDESMQLASSSESQAEKLKGVIALTKWSYQFYKKVVIFLCFETTGVQFFYCL